MGTERDESRRPRAECRRAPPDAREGERRPRGGAASAAADEDPQGDESETLPRRFGKYTLLRRLNAGGMAELYLALHRSVAGFEKLVVIKRILPPRRRDRAFIEMLLHEARVAATLSHPGIVHTFDVGEAEGRHFIAMEHIHGEDLRSVVRAMRARGVAEFPLEHAVGIALGVCAGLAYAHEKCDLEGRLLGIVHRDVSPQNVLVTFSGDVKLVDFGIAKSRDLREDPGGAELKGKVPYMSPEQALGREVDARSDVFAVGILLFELSTGKRLFKAATEDETLRLIVGRDYPPPSRVRPGYPPELERIVLRALAKDRRRRYQSAREMQQDLEDFVRHERLAVSKIGLARWMERLFEDKLAMHSAALHDVKQLADAIAATRGAEALEAVTESGAGAAAELADAAVAPPAPAAPPRVPARRLLAGLAGLVALSLAAAALAGRLSPPPPSTAPPALLAIPEARAPQPRPARPPALDAPSGGAAARLRLGARGGLCNVELDAPSDRPPPARVSFAPE